MGMGVMTFRKFGVFIVTWFEANKRDFPWRKADIQCDPYAVWISEVMLQQTQASRVVDFFEKFMEKFPTVDSLSRAQWEEVLECVRGLGYYRRFRNLIRAAQVVMNEFDGIFPHEYADLRKLPGVGEYTAGAILAFAYGENVVAMDTNVRQVLKKFFPKGRLSIGSLCDDELKKIAAKACPAGRAREFYQGMMDYAAAELRGKGQAERKHKGLSREDRINNILRIKVAVGLIIRGKEILIQKASGTCYEFPGGKIEPGETERACLKRELMEELGIEAAVRPPMMHTEYSYGEKHLSFSWHRCSILLGEPFGKEGQEIKWVAIKDLDQYTFLPADDEVIRSLLPARPSVS